MEQIFVTVTHDDQVVPGDQIVKRAAKQSSDVRNLFFDIRLISTDEFFQNEVGIVNAQIDAFADERLAKTHQGTFAQVIGPGLEGEPQQADFFCTSVDDEINRPLNLQLIALRDPAQQRRFNIQTFRL